MARPSRNASQGRLLLQSERNATLPIDVLRSYVRAGKFRLHDFVVMPDHVHLWMAVGGSITVEKARQFIKGGFSEARVENRQSFLAHREYIAANPVKEGRADSPAGAKAL